MFDNELAEVYDLVYAKRGQDFAAEAEQVATLIRRHRPAAASLLDVGCGTGEHLRTLGTLFGYVEGLDMSAAMLAVARTKLPKVTLHLADMRDFHLGRMFDAVISLSTAVAYLPSPEALAVALRCMVRHLSPDGVLIIEPWYFPDTFLDGHIAGDVLRGHGRTVSRVSRATRRPGAAQVDSHYVVADQHGIKHFTEVQVFGLWTREQYLEAFAEAGCAAHYVPGVQTRRGVFIGRRCDGAATLP